MVQASEKGIKYLTDNMNRGRPIPGQSLTNDPEQPYKWEKPPEFTVPREAMHYIFSRLIEPEVAENTLISLVNGIGVIDIASMLLYTGFLEGKWSPDLMLLLSEPTMYMIMALAEKAEIDYVLEVGDNKVREATPKEQISAMREGNTYLDSLRNKSSEGISEESIPKELREEIAQLELPTSLLERVGESEVETNENSLLARGEE
jgi:hypothetical protein